MSSNRQLFKDAAVLARASAYFAGRVAGPNDRPQITVGDIVEAAYRLGQEAGRP